MVLSMVPDCGSGPGPAFAFCVPSVPASVSAAVRFDQRQLALALRIVACMYAIGDNV